MPKRLEEGTMKKRLLAVPLAVAATLALYAAPAASASTASASRVAGCTPPLTAYIPEGHGEIQWCGRHVWGWLKDDRADGRCPFFRLITVSGHVEDTLRVGPAGATKSFDFLAADDVDDYNLRWASC
ncbi:hypothetical protein [Kitasatospora sp. NPDC059327]|uniref:hypothetical protein n=1 Tax=Kitasatospora sp. NPDC059327 TaxID=3346803 RepID=UPI003677ADF9